jgi:hypothetical protein
VEQRLGEESKARRQPLTLSGWALVAANIVPLMGVGFWGWDTFTLLYLFWMENVILGGYNILRIATASVQRPIQHLSKILIIPFFCFHYGLFTLAHGTILLEIFGEQRLGAVPSELGKTLLGPVLFAFWKLLPDIWLPLLALTLSHGISFASNYIRNGEYKLVNSEEAMFSPYGRVIVLHIAILGGGFAAQAIGEPMLALVALVLVKIVFDLAAHQSQHEQVRKKAESIPQTTAL